MQSRPSSHAHPVRRRLGCVIILMVMSIAAGAFAGPPAVCKPIDIGDASTLPLAELPMKTSKTYDRAKLITDVIAILDKHQADDDVFIHMETLRRATLYVRHDRAMANALRQTILTRLDTAPKGARTLRLLDAGFLTQAFEQAGLPLVKPTGEDAGIVGYAWIREALEAAPDNGRLEFAAAVVTASASARLLKQHEARAAAQADIDPLLAGNLKVHRAFWAHLRG
ncbi:MAG: hypothetical protein KC983_11100 [Phycisphaerales bacterium]|nr:hypothetical protein [Phycisphaerales bacterium]